MQERLKPMYADWKKQKYVIAVVHSGKEDLQRSTSDLLAYKKRCAELSVQRAKGIGGRKAG